jgi:hypothetical protein
MITTLAIHKNTLLAGSLNGLNFITLKSDTTGEFTIEKPFELSGFEVYKIKPVKHKVYLATNEGIVVCSSERDNEQGLNQPLYFTSFVINGKKQEVKEEYHLKNNQNNISISFEALNYKTSIPIEYKYGLKGLDKKWTYSTKREVNYFNLKPGKYNFTVQVKNTKGSWNDNEKVINVVIAPAIWQTIPFQIGLVLLISLLIILVYSFWQANARKKMFLERRVYNYKLKTLWGQMKPHFIFNTLNSINNYIISNSAVSASKYLTKFSALIRKIMDYTQYETISLEEELSTLELYVKIETLRLKQKFDFSITVDENIDKHNTQLPGLILQPFVENSIWHGIQPLDRKGTIKVRISKKESNLVIEIIDNGIGREKAMMKSKNNGNISKSYGAKIARERLNLFASKLNKKASVELYRFGDRYWCNWHKSEDCYAFGKKRKKKQYKLKRLIRNILIITALSTNYLKICSQEYAYTNSQTKDGLPSTEVYHAIQDSQGYIWFATDNGVSRFDGYKFVNFDINNGLVNNTVFDLYEDKKGRVWFIALSGRLCYYEDDKIVSLQVQPPY